MNRTLSNVRAKLKPRGVGFPKRIELPYFFLMTDEVRTPNPKDLVRKMPRGTGVIFRHYDIQERGDTAKNLRAICRQLGIGFFVGSDWRLAAKVNAHGLHMPAYMAAAGLETGARLWLRTRKKILTVAAHSAPELRRAKAINANAAFLSPIFQTKSHLSRRPLGSVRFTALARAAKIPVIALGGITEKNIPTVYLAGCAGVSGISILSEE